MAKKTARFEARVTYKAFYRTKKTVSSAEKSADASAAGYPYLSTVYVLIIFQIKGRPIDLTTATEFEK